jgi:hypothetical protein
MNFPTGPSQPPGSDIIRHSMGRIRKVRLNLRKLSLAVVWSGYLSVWAAACPAQEDFSVQASPARSGVDELLSGTSRVPGQASRRDQSNAVELTSSNISDYLNRLRDDKSPADYVVKGEIRLSGSREQWYVKSLRFDKDAVIYLGSTNLTIFAGEISAISRDTVVFASFPKNELEADSGRDGSAGDAGPDSGTPAAAGGRGGSGGDGEPGHNGRDSGDLTLQLRSVPSIGFGVALLGQSGGRGGTGGPGGRGGSGQKGRPGESGAFGCKRGGDNGGSGGSGGDGGNGGPGGSCGAGGKLTVLAPGPLLNRIQDRISVSTLPAIPGNSGSPGASGPGGRGGDGGDGSGFCGGGAPGPTGPPGRTGSSANTIKTPCKSPTTQFIPLS